MEITTLQPTVLNKKITSAKDVYDYLYPMKDLQQEYFIVLLLNTKNVILKKEVVAIGTLNGALIHPREIFKSAIKESANSIIVVHNHPSGDPTPSPEDSAITKRLVECGELLGILVLDHVIIGKELYSFMT